MAALTVWIFSFPALIDVILETVKTDFFQFLLLGGNEGFKHSEKVDLVFYQRECLEKNMYKDFENDK